MVAGIGCDPGEATDTGDSGATETSSSTHRFFSPASMISPLPSSLSVSLSSE